MVRDLILKFKNKIDIEKLKEEVKDENSEITTAYWNYRIVKHTSTYKLGEEEICDTYYNIHEFYYNKFDKIIAWSEDSTPLIFEDYSDFKTILNQFKQASKYPILEFIEEDENKVKVINTGLYLKDIKLY